MAKIRDLRWLSFLILFTILTAGGFISLYTIFAINRTENTLIEQQKAKIVNIANLFDKNFEGTFQDILEYDNLSNAPKIRKIKALNDEFKELAIQFTEIYPGVNVGTFSSELGAIIVGGRNYKYYIEGQYTGQDGFIKKTLSENRPLFFRTVTELQYYKPLVREGKSIGVVWVSENLFEIYNKTSNTKRNVYIVFILSLLLILGFAVSILLYYVRGIRLVRNALADISTNFNIKLPIITGELGEIAGTINNLGQQLNESRSLTEVVIQSVQEGIAVIDKKGVTVLANDFAREILDTLQSGSNEELHVQLANGGVFDTRKVTWFDGREKHTLLVDSVPMKDAHSARVVTFKDITTEEKSEQKMHVMQRFVALGKMVAGVAHEIRNPLTSIAGYIQFWRKKGLNHLTEDSLETISKEITRLNDFVEKLLFFSKTSTSLDEPADLKTIIREITTFVTMTYPDMTIALEDNVFLPVVHGDTVQLHSVLENIIFNAVQAMDEKGEVAITSTYDATKENICVAITDRGKGISSEHIEYVFDPFFTTKPKGTGLGLAISYEIVRMHKGDITIQSQLGEGTTVTVCLPYKEEITSA